MVIRHRRRFERTPYVDGPVVPPYGSQTVDDQPAIRDADRAGHRDAVSTMIEPIFRQGDTDAIDPHKASSTPTSCIAACDQSAIVPWIPADEELARQNGGIR